MTPELNNEVVRVAEEALPGSGPTLRLALRAAGETPAERYERPADTQRAVPAGEALVVLKRVALLSTLDEVRVASATHDDATFSIAMEIRRYEGDIAANDPRAALVQVELGEPARGAYTIVVTEATSRFQDAKHPEQAADPTRATERLRFSVR